MVKEMVKILFPATKNIDWDVVKNGDLNKSNEESYKRNILNKKLIQETSLGNIFKQQGE